MNVLLPWNLANYIPLNAFHPLYKSLGDVRDPECRLLVPRFPRRQQSCYFQRLGLDIEDIDTSFCPWPQTKDCASIFKNFVRAHHSSELKFTSVISADIDLLHTAPISLGVRPFFLHVESFLPTFYPFFQQGGAQNERVPVNRLRSFYQEIFESDQCLAVASHIRETLDQFSEFFKSSRIDKKLVASPIGIDRSFISSAPPKLNGEFKFVFLNSAHQQSSSFSLRGGLASLILARNLLSSGIKAKFFFRTTRPNDAWLLKNGIDPREIRSFEGKSIFWLQNYLSDRMLNDLVARCHFLLLPSANLHSVSILSAMVNGTIPIVTDTVGTELYVENGFNGIVLRGVKARIWKTDSVSRVTVDDHSAFFALQADLAHQLEKEVRALLSGPEKIRRMADNCRATVNARFSGEKFSSWLVSEIKERGRALPASRNAALNRVEGERWLEDIQPTHFDGPPAPLLKADFGFGRIYQIGGRFVFVPRERLRETVNEFWSPLNLAREDEGLGAPPRVRTLLSFQQAIEVAAEFARHGSRSLTKSIGFAPAGPGKSLPEFVAARLDRYPRFYRFAQFVWRVYRYREYRR